MLQFTRLASISFITISASFSGCGFQASTTTADPSTVHIPNSPVKNQNSLGICWSYAALGLVEAVELQHGKTVDLSEEYLGYHWVLRQLDEAVNSQEPMNYLSFLNEGYRSWDGLKLAEEVGLVPESVFSSKYTDSQVEFTTSLKTFFSPRFQDANTLASYKTNPERLAADFDRFLGKRLPRPTDTITVDGRSFTPVSYLKNGLNFRLNDFEEVVVKSTHPEQLEPAMHSFKMSLMQGFPVPLGVLTFNGVSSGPVWDTSTCEGDCPKSFGHAMLGVDFITQGGRGGAMTEAEVRSVFHNPVSAVIVKNSWGLQGADQAGRTDAARTKLGFNTLTRSYLEESLKSMSFSFIVAKSVYDPTKPSIGASLRTHLVGPDFAEAGEVVSVSAQVFDVPRASSATDIKYVWTVATVDGTIISRSSGSSNFSLTFPEAGAYEVILETSLGTNKHVVTRKIWVAPIQSASFRSATNMLRTEGRGADLRLLVDSTQPQSHADLNTSVAEMAPITIQPGGRVGMKFEIYKPLKDKGLFPEPRIQVGDKGIFKELKCDTEKVSKEGDVHLLYTFDCIYPVGDGLVGNSPETLQIVFETHQMPQTEHKNFGVAEVRNFQVQLAGGTIAPVANLPARYPEDSSYKVFAVVGHGASLAGEFAAETDAVSVSVDGTEIQRLSNLQPLDGNWVRLNAPVSFTKDGFHRVRLTALRRDGVAGAFLDFDVYVSSVFQIPVGQPTEQRLADQNVFVLDNNWTMTQYGISASPFTNDGRAPLPLQNDMLGTGVLRLDLSEHQSLKMTLSTHVDLEEDWDMLHVSISVDGGKSFSRVASDTGKHAWKSLVADLTPYVGHNDVIVRLDVVTDSGGESSHCIIGSLAFE